MKVYQDYSVRGTPEALESLMRDVEASLANGWTRDALREGHLEPRDASMKRCFVCDKRENREEGSLFLIAFEEKELQVTNIVPSEDKRHLSYDEYNYILQEFHSQFVSPHAAKHGVLVELSDSDVGLSQWLTEDAEKKLKRFSHAANKATCAAHPNDRERWYDFLIAAHREKSSLDYESLRRWLHEEERWGEVESAELASDYESSRLLLAYYDQECRGE